MWNPTWSAFSISSKPAVTVRIWSILCMLLLPQSTVPTRRFRTARMTRLITRYLCMRQLRNPMNWWHTPTPSSTSFLPLVCASSQCTVLQVVLTWLILALPTNWWRVKPSRSSTMATASVTLLMWMTLLRALSVWWRRHRTRRTVKMVCRFRRMQFTTSVIRTLRTCWTSCRFWVRS